jgi:hypothetical protein
LLGLLLGLGDGGLLGSELGWELGRGDGSLLGVELGRDDDGGMVGPTVGCELGRDDGSLLGVMLGRDVGNALGLIEGEVLGAEDGMIALVGPLDPVGVGPLLGESLGK